jgi:hypothetical protein
LRVLKRKQPQPRKILGGIYRPDAGEFRFNEVAKFAEPTVTDFICAPLVETMSVSENIALVAGYARQGGLISWRETREIGRQLLIKFAPEPFREPIQRCFFYLLVFTACKPERFRLVSSQKFPLKAIR